MILDSSIETNGQNWISQTAFWARAIAVISLLGGGTILLFTDWGVGGIPGPVIMALAMGGPAIGYFTLSFFVRRANGNICTALGVLGIVHVVAMAAAAVYEADRLDFTVYVVLGAGLTAGVGNLIGSAFWARQWIRQPMNLMGQQRGFEVFDLETRVIHSIVIDREK